MKKITFNEIDSKLINGLVQFGFMVGLFGLIICLAMSSAFFVGETKDALEITLPMTAGCFLLFVGSIFLAFKSGLMSVVKSDQD
ncbi:hypothetical protein A3715_11360 [Oleiphilus sp. HI0009]|nr:hypothetical protein A3715_11360 [Oleiphilus sp. HI0009]